MKCYNYLSVCLMTLVALTNSLGYDRMDLIRGAQRSSSRRNGQQNRNGNNYVNSLVGNVGSTRGSGRSCYDRCYDVYMSGLQRSVLGCSCSRFDFQQNRGTIRRNQLNSQSRLSYNNNNNNNINSNNNCNCPVGTVCEYQLGSVSCLRVNSRNRNVNPRYDSRNINQRINVQGNGNGRRNLGMPGGVRLGGHCGYLTPACLASQTESRKVLRYTYSYELRSCIRQHVYTDCEVRGTRNNLFANRQGCSRSCF